MFIDFLKEVLIFLTSFNGLLLFALIFLSKIISLLNEIEFVNKGGASKNLLIKFSFSAQRFESIQSIETEYESFSLIKKKKSCKILIKKKTFFYFYFLLIFYRQ